MSAVPVSRSKLHATESECAKPICQYEGEFKGAPFRVAQGEKSEKMPMAPTSPRRFMGRDGLKKAMQRKARSAIASEGEKSKDGTMQQPLRGNHRVHQHRLR